MKKRLLCGFFAAVILLSLLSVAGVQASAAELTASEDCIALLKELEGFSARPYYDHGQYSVGYGSGCGKNDYPNGITEAQADALLRKYVKSMVAQINKFASTNKLSFSQTQFDALVLFTYNVGAGWMFSSSDLRTAVINGAQGNDFLYYFTRWSTASNQTTVGLVKRRLAEADLYLNGVYSATAPSHYSYVLFNSNGGDCVSRIQGYDASQPPKIIPTPVHEDSGLRFLGWYTEIEGGAWVTDLDTTTAAKTLYAHWQKHNIQKGYVNYQRKISANGVTVYEKPGSSQVTGKLTAGTVVKIIQDFMDSGKIKWGRLSSGGWIQLTNTEAVLRPAEKPVRQSVTVKVTGNYVNVRTGPGTNYPKAGTARAGQTLTITETKVVNGTKWGKFTGGWICLMYTDYDSISQSENDKNEDVIATGTVACSGYLNIRAGAGVNYGVVGTLANGTKVNIYEKKTASGQVWGRLSNGWICLSYVKLTTTPAPDNGSNQEPDQEQGGGAEQKPNATKTGTVINCTALNIRQAPGTHSPKVGTLKKGDRVVILEETVYNNKSWGRMDKGWICMNYVRVEEGGSGNTFTGTVNANGLRIRSAPGVQNAVVGVYKKGSRVSILDTATVNGVAWGRTDKGWICLQYVTR